MATNASKPQTHVETPDEAAAAEAAAAKAAKVAQEAAGEAGPEASEVVESEVSTEAAAKAAEDATATAAAQTTEAPAASATKKAESNDAAESFIKRIDTWLTETFPSSKNAVLGGIAGLIVALLFFAIGFWRTLFIVALVLVGVALGQCADGDPKIVRALSKLIKKR